MSMGWRRSLGQSTNLPIIGAAFAPLRHATTPSSCDAKPLSRRIRQIVGALVVFLIAALTSTITFAEEPSPVQKAAENYYPKLVKKFPPNRTSPCGPCKDKQETLNAAWQELFRFDKDHADVRAVHKAWNAEIAAKEALAAATKAGVGVKDAQSALDKAKANTKTVEDKNKVTSNAYQDEEKNWIK
jgi:hypothetical protein